MQMLFFAHSFMNETDTIFKNRTRKARKQQKEECAEHRNSLWMYLPPVEVKTQTKLIVWSTMYFLKVLLEDFFNQKCPFL